MGKRIVYFVSESTGITAEALGNSLLSQFPHIDFDRRHMPYINTLERAEELAVELEDVTGQLGYKPLVFATMPDKEIDALLESASCHYYELFENYLEQIGRDIGTTPTRESGLSHGLTNAQSYDARIETVNYTLMHDDAMTMKNLSASDVILVGVSRSGKTPTSLYLALHYGVKAANYPLTEDDFLNNDLPSELKGNLRKLVALTIQPERLQQVRSKRRPDSRYSSLETCVTEIKKAENLFKRYRLDTLDTTSRSIEEMASEIVRVHKLKAMS